MLSIRARSAVRRATVAATAGVALLGLTACEASVSTGDDESKVVRDQVVAAITKQYEEQGIPVTQVRCGDGIEGKAGTPISCTGLNDKGTTLVITGSVTRWEDGKGSFSVKTTSARARGTVIAAQTKSALEKSAGEEARSVTCPAVVPVPTTPDVTCTLTTMDGTALDVRVTVDQGGALNAKVATKPNP
ncbi:DUF4333 domain-containing protein [Patulibacter minatonensis]|uniref:DUF4333 domain-containing protein n=1 Tax=Patulibacter minatonensis TaxID=298163 RepID=UPI00047B6D30|nr:DUF4333 domain-containing protein [Patulibacter minatonensis]